MTTDLTRAAEIVESLQFMAELQDAGLTDVHREVLRSAASLLQRPTDTARAGEALKGKADSAKGWFRRAFAAEARVLELESRLRKIATGSIKGEPGNHKDALSICQGIASELLTTASPVADETLTDEVQRLIAIAYAAGCQAVHDNYQEDRDPDFSEAASDYARSIDLAALASTPQPASAETVELRDTLAKMIYEFKPETYWFGSESYPKSWGSDSILPAFRDVAYERADRILAAIRQSAKGSGDA